MANRQTLQDTINSVKEKSRKNKEKYDALLEFAELLGNQYVGAMTMIIDISSLLKSHYELNKDLINSVSEYAKLKEATLNEIHKVNQKFLNNDALSVILGNNQNNEFTAKLKNLTEKYQSSKF
jgi:hypothetical protein